MILHQQKHIPGYNCSHVHAEIRDRVGWHAYMWNKIVLISFSADSYSIYQYYNPLFWPVPIPMPILMQVLNHEVWNGVSLTGEPVPVIITLITEAFDWQCGVKIEGMHV